MRRTKNENKSKNKQTKPTERLFLFIITSRDWTEKYQNGKYSIYILYLLRIWYLQILGSYLEFALLT